MKKLNVGILIFEMKNKVEVIASVCTGAFLFAISGVINTLKVITHWIDIAEFQSIFPELQVKNNARLINEGNILFSAGISAGFFYENQTIFLQ